MAQAKLVLGKLKELGVTHVVGLPDNASAALFALLERDRDIFLLNVTREGEAFAVAAGIWMGGGTPVVLIQNTGLLESGDSFRGTVMRMRAPLPCLITYRGHESRARYALDSAAEAPDEDTFSRPDLDSTGLVTEPTLRAWGLPFDFLREDQDMPKISWAFGEAERRKRPIALLITSNLV